MVVTVVRDQASRLAVGREGLEVDLLDQDSQVMDRVVRVREDRSRRSRDVRDLGMVDVRGRRVR